MPVPDPPDLMRVIILVSRKPQLTLFTDYIEDVPRFIGKIRISCFAAALPLVMELLDTGCEEQHPRLAWVMLNWRVVLDMVLLVRIVRHRHSGGEKARVSTSWRSW